MIDQSIDFLMGNHFQFLLSKFFQSCLIVVFLILGCNYDPDDEYYADIDPPSQPTAQITINNQDSIIVLWQVTECNYNFSSPDNLKTLSVDVYIDDELVASFTSSTVQFTINPEDYSAGNHNLQIKTVTNSGSGSLGDRVGAEEFIFMKELDLYIENRWPESIYITEFINENGLLKISWEKFGRINFQNYMIYRSRTTRQSGSDYFELAAIITDSSINYFYDSTYVGGERAYIVNVTAGYHTVSGIIDSVIYPLPKVLEAQSDGPDLFLTFSKCLFPAAFKEYRLLISPDEYNEDIEKGVIKNVEDTVFAIQDLFFGSSYKLKLSTYPVNIEYGVFDKEYIPTTLVNLHVGDTSFVFNQIEALSTGDIYLTKNYDGGSIYKYSEGIISEILHKNDDLYGNNSFHISEDGNYLVYRDVINNHVSLYTLPDMVKISETEDFYIPWTSRISNNGLTPVFTSHELMIYDFFLDKFIDTLYTNHTGIYPGGSYYGGISHISPDGDYLYVISPDYNADTIYHRSPDNNYTSIGALNANIQFIAFNPLKEGELIYYDENYNQNNLNIFDYKTMTVNRTFGNLHPPFSNIDPVTGNILALDNSEERRFGIYNILDGTRKGSVRIAYNVPIDNLRLYNSVLYSSNGYKIKVLP